MRAALVPVKTLDQAKSRLSACLDAGQRRSLTLAMVTDVVSVLLNSEQFDAVYILSRDPEVHQLAEGWPVHMLSESPGGTLNDALSYACDELAAQGVGQLAIFPCDLPLLDMAAIEDLIASAKGRDFFVIAPDKTFTGTNAVLVSPVDKMPWSFGPGSFNKHIACAEERGLPASMVRNERLALDIDAPEDMGAFLNLKKDGQTLTCISRFEMTKRLMSMIKVPA